jgi:RNA polymerase sigma factor (sigma-70 family)
MFNKKNEESNNHFLGIENFDYENMNFEEKNDFHSKLFSFCYVKAIRSLYNEDLANNVAQDVSFIIVKNIKKYNPKVAKFLTWLSVILKREILKVKKHRDAQKRKIPIASISPHVENEEEIQDNRLISEENVELQVEKKIMLIELKRAVNTMDERQKKIYQMYFIEEKTLSAIGKQVGLSHEGVRLNVEKIKKHLKHYFIELELVGA